MAPSVTLETSSDFALIPTKPSASTHTLRTLLLSPPSISSHPERLENILATHDRHQTDIQMLDRLALSLVALPQSTYDLVLLLADADNRSHESSDLFSHSVFRQLFFSLKAGGKIQAQSGGFHFSDAAIKEAILAGLVIGDEEILKPNETETRSIPLRFGKKKNSKANASALATGAEAMNLNGKREIGTDARRVPAGVGYDDGGEFDSDDELIDETTLLNEEDMKTNVTQPPECRPKQGKRRRACKDCTCGLAQKLEAEDRATREKADSNLAKLNADDLAEVDFTVQGKVGSCGNCALGDAFRCDGCPYIGLPAFKPGEEVRLLNDDVQL